MCDLSLNVDFYSFFLAFRSENNWLGEKPNISRKYSAVYSEMSQELSVYEHWGAFPYICWVSSFCFLLSIARSRLKIPCFSEQLLRLSFHLLVFFFGQLGERTAGLACKTCKEDLQKLLVPLWAPIVFLVVYFVFPGALSNVFNHRRKTQRLYTLYWFLSNLILYYHIIYLLYIVI